MFRSLPYLAVVVGVLLSLPGVTQVSSTLDVGSVAYTSVPINLRDSESFASQRNVLRVMQPGERFTVMGRGPRGHLYVRTLNGEIGYLYNQASYFRASAQTTSRPTTTRTKGTPSASGTVQAASVTRAQQTPVTSAPTTTTQPATQPQASPTTSVVVAPLLMPLCGCTSPRCRQTSSFGYRRHPILRTTRLHAGVDIGAPTGQIVRAAADGVVASTTNSNSGWGNHVVLSHNGSLSNNQRRVVSRNGFETQYNHLSRISVSRGQQVRRGQEVGRIGQSGLATGPHLCFNVRTNGNYQDPVQFFGQGSLSTSGVTQTCDTQPATSPIQSGGVESSR